jgi:hypothetical protein
MRYDLWAFCPLVSTGIRWFPVVHGPETAQAEAAQHPQLSTINFSPAAYLLCHQPSN